MGVADEQDLYIGEAKAELFDAVADEGDVGVHAAVDEDMALRRGDEIGGQAFAAHIVDVGDDAVRGKGGGPVGRVLGGNAAGHDSEGKKEKKICIFPAKHAKESSTKAEGGIGVGQGPESKSAS